MKEKVRKLIQEHQTAALAASFVIVGLLIGWVSSSSGAPPPPPEPAELSTFIPRGHVLIPIELKNADQLDGILGSHGIVDLFESSDVSGVRSRLIGRRLRLVRAPLNPKAFAVLVKDQEAERLLSFQGPVIASVRSKDSSRHEFPTAEHRARIEFQNEVTK